MSVPARAASRIRSRAVAAPSPVPARPRLEVVDAPSRRRASPAALVAGAVVMLFLVLIALASFQTVLVSSRQRLDDLEREVAAQQDRYQDLTVDVARLEAPNRILTTARDRLGMVPAGAPTYVTASGEVVAEVEARAADAAMADEDAAMETGGDDVATDPIHTAPPATAWPDVKPYLEPAP